MGEKAAFAVVSLHLYILSYIPVQCYPPPRHMHSDFGVFSNGIRYATRITTAERNPEVKLLTNI